MDIQTFRLSLIRNPGRIIKGLKRKLFKLKTHEGKACITQLEIETLRLFALSDNGFIAFHDAAPVSSDPHNMHKGYAGPIRLIEELRNSKELRLGLTHLNPIILFLRPTPPSPSPTRGGKIDFSLSS